jgi:hypothetical protein
MIYTAPTALRVEHCRIAAQIKFRVLKDEMLGPRRTTRVARPRMVAMMLARELTGASLPQIGMLFGRDHTTCLHAGRRVRELASQSPAFAQDVEDVRLTLLTRKAAIEQAAWDERDRETVRLNGTEMG